MTCCIPPQLLRWCGMPRKDVQMAWREKIALCFIIALCCGALLFFIIGLGIVVCPRVHILSFSEFSSRTTATSAYALAYGKVFDVTSLLQDHLNSYTIPTYAWAN